MAKKDDDLAKLIRHLRRMIWSDTGKWSRPPDAFSILVRGIILIDEALEYVIDAYSAIPWKKLDENVHRLSIAEKAHIARALGAISEGELTCIKAINGLRNRAAHQMNTEVSQQAEADLVAIFKSQTKIFRGLNYRPEGHPIGLLYIMLILVWSLRFRTSRPNIKHVYADDKTNTEHMGAIALTIALVEVMQKEVEADDDAVRRIIIEKTDEANKLREHPDLGSDGMEKPP